MAENTKKGEASVAGTSPTVEERIATLQDTVNKLQEKLDAASPTQSDERVEKLQNTVDQLQAVIKQTSESSIATAEAAAKAAKIEKQAARSDATFSLNKEKFEFKVHRFKIDGKVWTAAEVMALPEKESKAFLADLYSKQSGVIGPVEKED